MATTFYLLNTDPSISISGSYTRGLSTSRGSGVTSTQYATTSGGNHIQNNNDYIWAKRISGVTISGSIIANLRALEAAMTVNAQIAVRICRYDSSGNFVSDVVADTHANHTYGTELGTSEAAQNWTISSPTSTTFSNGDILVIFVHADNSGTMNTGGATFYYNGTTSNASGDSYITFNETITDYTGVTYSKQAQAQAYIQGVSRGYSQSATIIKQYSRAYAQALGKVLAAGQNSTTKTWNFTSDMESWTGVTNGELDSVSWSSSESGVISGTKTASGSEFGGSTYYEGTWESMGVPSGATVYSVAVIYYCWHGQPSAGLQGFYTGPVTLRNSSGVLRETLAAATASKIFTDVIPPYSDWQSQGPYTEVVINDASNTTVRIQQELTITFDGSQSVNASLYFDSFQIEIIYTQSSANSVSTFGQAQARIKNTYNAYAQSQTRIKTAYRGYAQSQTDIKQTYRGYSQTQSQIQKVGYGISQVQARIKGIGQGYAQSQTDIKTTYRAYSQAQVNIKQTYRGYAQARSQIQKIGQGFSQVQADIKATSRSYAQTQAHIEQTYRGYAQASVIISRSVSVYSQARAQILKNVVTTNNWAQAVAYVYTPQYARPSADDSNNGLIRVVIS